MNAFKILDIYLQIQNRILWITFKESVILSPDSVTPPSLPTSAGSMTSKSSFSRVRKLLTLDVVGIIILVPVKFKS